MKNMKFGVIITPCPSEEPNVRTGDATLESLVEFVKLLEKLGYDEVWFRAEVDAPRFETTEFQTIVREVSQATNKIELGIGIHPVGDAEPVSSRVQSVRQQNKEISLKFAIASQVSPASAALAGAHGLGLLSIGATTPAGFSALPGHWEIYTRKMREKDHLADRSNWSLSGPTHLAKTRKQAMAQTCAGAAKWFQQYAEMGMVPASANESDPVEAMSEHGFATIGTPKNAVGQIRRLQKQTGGFGTFLLPLNNWANSVHTEQSLALFARHVFPRFRSTDQK